MTREIQQPASQSAELMNSPEPVEPGEVSRSKLHIAVTAGLSGAVVTVSRFRAMSKPEFRAKLPGRRILTLDQSERLSLVTRRL
jgi:hypothetical protein